MTNEVVDWKEQADVDAEEWLEKRPRCVCCGEPIQDDHAYRFDGKLWCEDCVNNEFREDLKDE